MQFSRQCRLRSSREFVRLRKVGKWIPGRFFHLQVSERDDATFPSRLGLSVSKRIGNAVTRNLVKRRFRELFRSVASDLRPPVDMVVIARKGVDSLPFADLKLQFKHAVRPWLDTFESE